MTVDSRRRTGADYPGPIGVGETREDVQAAVAAQVSMLVLTMRPGQVLTVECRDDDREMFRVKRETR